MQSELIDQITSLMNRFPEKHCASIGKLCADSWVMKEHEAVRSSWREYLPSHANG